MNLISTAPITTKQYLEFRSPEGYRDELIYGRIVVSPNPKPLHVQIAENVYNCLRRQVDKRLKVTQRINLRFDAIHSMPSLDVLVLESKAWLEAIRSNTYPAGTNVILAVEVLSPGNRSKAVQQKVDLYRKHGIVTWVIQPTNKPVRVFEEDRVTNFSGEDLLPLPTRLGGKSKPSNPSSI